MTAAADTGYAPRPGTVAHRVLALLEEEAPREFSVAMICERLPGIELGLGQFQRRPRVK